MFKIFYLSQCGYSKKSLEIINKYNLSNESDKINCEDENNFMNDPDSKYIPIDYSTYPKILYLRKKKIQYLLVEMTNLKN